MEKPLHLILIDKEYAQLVMVLEEQMLQLFKFVLLAKEKVKELFLDKWDQVCTLKVYKLVMNAMAKVK
jgi:hypothetical protein